VSYRYYLIKFKFKILVYFIDRWGCRWYR